MNKPWDPLQELLLKIKQQGGMVNAHAHFDRAYTINKKDMSRTSDHLFQKWSFVDKFKSSATESDYFRNISSVIESQINFGTQAALTFIDIDDVCEYRALNAAIKAKQAYPEFLLKIACQTLKGVTDKKSRHLIENALDYIDVIGSLPGKDKGYESEHLDIVMGWAKETNKRLHVHVDQLNSPLEKETELLCRKTMEHGLEGRVTAVHSISLACHSKKYRDEVYKMAKDSAMSFVSCPSAWIDHPRSEELMPFHNALTPVDELLQNNLIVALGTDNICDIYKPYSNGDLMNEIRLIIDGCKIYNEQALINISVKNGLAIIQ